MAPSRTAARRSTDRPSTLQAAAAAASLLALLAAAAAPLGTADARLASPPTMTPMPVPPAMVPLARPSEAIIPGADPTGVNDSSVALMAYIRTACAEAGALFPAPAGGGLSRGPADVVVDLAGGVYRLDAPLAVNASLSCNGYLRVVGGTLLAGPGLGTAERRADNSSFLVTVLGYSGLLGVSLEHVRFACNFTSGGVRVDSMHHIHILHSVFLNFRGYGIWGSKALGMGHELLVADTRLTECTGGMHPCQNATDKSAVAIQMEFPDSHFRNVVISCTKVGIVDMSGANSYSQIHAWPSCNPTAAWVDDMIAMDIHGGKTRIVDSYIDNSRLRVKNYAFLTITSSYFNGGAQLELASPDKMDVPEDVVGASSADCQYWEGAMCGLVVSTNMFGCSQGGCALINVSYVPDVASQMYVANNVFQSGIAGSTCTAMSHCNGSCAELFVPCK